MNTAIANPGTKIVFETVHGDLIKGEIIRAEVNASQKDQLEVVFVGNYLDSGERKVVSCVTASL